MIMFAKKIVNDYKLNITLEKALEKLR